MHSACHVSSFAFWSAVMLRLANVMQFALASAEAFPAQHGASPANADIENVPAPSRANIVLIMLIRQHGSADVQLRR